MNRDPAARSELARSRLLVLGATGGTGRLIVKQALARGFAVRALVRSREKATDLAGAELFVGDARDQAALALALEGQDAVVSALGTPVSPFREVTVLSSATNGLVAAMKAAAVRRLVCVRHRSRRQRRTWRFLIRPIGPSRPAAQGVRRQGRFVAVSVNTPDSTHRQHPLHSGSSHPWKSKRQS